MSIQSDYDAKEKNDWREVSPPRWDIFILGRVSAKTINYWAELKEGEQNDYKN